MNLASNHDFGKVAVLMGGWSAEREISLLSGRAVLQALKGKNIDAYGIDVGRDIARVLGAGDYDSALIMLHGRGGEDGAMQGLLEVMGLPYTGSGILGSALAMDKLRCKQVWAAEGFPTPEYMQIETEQDADTAIVELGLPLIVKPALEGSSIGMSKVEAETEMLPAFIKARECSGAIIAERWITGAEYTAAIINRKVLPMIRLETDRKFYDYFAKYESDDTRYICPCGLELSVEKELGEVMLNAFDAIGASGWGRVDFFLDTDGRPWLIEANTVPGMTSHSLVPMAAKQAGIGFDELVIEILRSSHER
ncbi:MAG: D-alanine--D-alanine ligase [Gammaproteobacteria bacterium]|nr:D-alanine--D-alanine ligase [Gammaproteobacteria bacterium]NNJ97117.1 D-alanine--D-alanine ligase [Gammaproteobacteria bacterium]